MGRLTVPYRKTRLDAGGYQVEFVAHLTASLVIKSKKTSQPAEVMRYSREAFTRTRLRIVPQLNGNN